MASIAISAPWTVLGFWNALIGLIIATRKKAPESVELFQDARSAKKPLKSRIAVAMAIRNEDPERAFSRLAAIRQSLDKTDEADAFDLFIISDTDDESIARDEENLFAKHLAALGGCGKVHYRRRTDNTGYKAGNVWEFLRDFGGPIQIFRPTRCGQYNGRRNHC